MKNVIDILRERDMIKQIVYEDELYELLGKESVSFYVGFDPTADSLHVGHFVQLMAMAHMQKAGHCPIILVGGGTGMIGDPSGRSTTRNLLTPEIVKHNSDAFKVQMRKFLNFEGKNAAIMVDNADWLNELNYIKFLREIGSHFSVNKMLTAECFKAKLETGLSFLEFNYMLMQSYDFYVLFKKYNCMLEFGGDDQWSNMLAGVDLIRRKEKKKAFAMTFKLLANSEGVKMGKTAKGALWLDAKKTSPFEFYQYWRNREDQDINNCMKLLTFMPVKEIDELTQYRDERMNIAKKRLAFEVTKLVHGEAEAMKAEQTSDGLFSGVGESENMPTMVLQKKEFSGNINIVDLLVASKVASSKSEARRLVEQGGITIDGDKVSQISSVINISKNGNVIKKGKKSFTKVILK